MVRFQIILSNCRENFSFDGIYFTPARYYTQGYDRLIVGVDRKPLLGIINGKWLEDIDNMRLRRLKEKTVVRKFNIVHTAQSRKEKLWS